MNRRSVLALCGAVATGLAGCGGSSGGADETATGATAATSETTGLSVESVGAPASVELGRSYPVRFEVANPADSERTLATPVSVRTGGEWQSFRTLEARVPPGTTTLERQLSAPRFLGTYRFRLDDPRAEWQVEATERRLGFGEAFDTPSGLALSVLGGRFSDGYTGATNETVTPSADQQFLLVRVRVTNDSDESRTLPPFGVFGVQVGDETFDVALANPGQRLTVDPGTRKEVELPFLVPASATVGDVAVRWTPRYRAGRTVAVWRQG